MIVPRVFLLLVGAGIALLGCLSPDTYFNARRSSDIPFYRGVCIVVGLVFVIFGLAVKLRRH